MKTNFYVVLIIFTFAGALVCYPEGTSSLSAGAPPSAGTPASSIESSVLKNEHTQWLKASLKEMETIKVGSTRAELLKVFKPNGGWSTPVSGSYTYRDCQFIAVDVEFGRAPNINKYGDERPDDIITKISKPTIEWPELN